VFEELRVASSHEGSPRDSFSWVAERDATLKSPECFHGKFGVRSRFLKGFARERAEKV
jgi:hypothetical protein